MGGSPLSGQGALTSAGSSPGAGLDLTDNAHTDNSCSVASYTADKFYEYVAVAEMLYTLATDKAAREQLFAELRGSALGRYLGAPRGEAIYQTYEFLKEKWFGDPIEAERHRQLGIDAVDEWQASQEELYAAIADSLMNIYEEFKRRFTQCGMLYGFATLGVDGTFFLGELAIGAGIAGVTAKALKSMKFVVSRLKDGSVVVRATTAGGGKLERTFTKEALEAKYGKPDDNHFGSLEHDTNREIPDKSADDLLKEKRTKEAAEAKARRQDEHPDGSYRDPVDPKGVRRAADGEAIIQDRDGNWTRVSDMPRRDNVYTGRWGETTADRYATEQGWEKINGPSTTMDSPFTGPNRIDAIYRDPGPPPRYIVSDAKALGAKQGTTKDDVLQMSKQWIEERLGKAGLSRADMRALQQGKYDPVLLKVDKNGNVTEVWLDKDGMPASTPTWRKQ
ncbi:hypothetical protein C8J27_106277 [Rhodobacter aestuarii]|uniref:Uncharacterized protein n=1 Tax=Rhodobacter aestuarii TaxID=453582 RepID=A0A1N7MDD4_9RHOB|nr:hypothetical protein [Rhodobacter aestuarii]PTV95007.1 hypothetical protein C8J27_106277 [Rhodobacter aestuarii]SIS84021.1 hypothetical protein SAMN05421580_105277 [Rhodobacter aestuarii]